MTLNGVQYTRIDDAGLHIETATGPQTLNVENVVLCAGQESERGLYEALQDRHPSVHCIGGAEVAAELDAKRAIAQGTKLALSL